MATTHSHIALPSTFDNGTFARYEPFGDGRDVVVRRGREMGFHYGFEKSRRVVRVGGQELDLIRYEYLLTCGAGTAEVEVLRLPDAELSIPTGERGFSELEIEHILAAVTFG